MDRRIGRVLITGAGGQLGQDVVDAFAAIDSEVVGLAHEDLDVGDRSSIDAAFKEHKPDTVVHCAAWTNVDGCEEDAEKAHRINALGSGWIAAAAERNTAAVIAISTDYVFDGQVAVDPSATRPYTEFDPLNPISEYGRSKAAGEVLVRQANPRHHIVRTAWVCGARGNNFVKTMLRVGREHGAARVVDDQWGSPTFTRDLAAAIVELAGRDDYGTWHRTSRGQVTWHDFAAAVFADAGVEVELTSMPSTELDRPAPRPAWSVLSHLHAESAGLSPMPTWRASLRAMLAELGELRADLQTKKAN